MQCYAMLCYAMLCYAMLCYAMLCYAMLCYAMLCYAMLCGTRDGERRVAQRSTGQHSVCATHTHKCLFSSSLTLSSFPCHVRRAVPALLPPGVPDRTWRSPLCLWSLCVCGDRSLFGWAWHALRASSAAFRHSSVWRTATTTARCVSRRTPRSRASPTYCLSRLSDSSHFYWVLFPLSFVGIPVPILLVGITNCTNAHFHGNFLVRCRREPCYRTRESARGRIWEADSCFFDTSRGKLSPIWCLETAGQCRHEATRI